MDVSAIIQEYGAYYLNSGQNMARLKRLLLFGRETVKNATPIKTNDTVYQMGSSYIDSIVQPFQKTYTPKGNPLFKPNPIYLYHMKVDMDIWPDDIEATWLGFLAANNLSRKEWPLIRYLLEVHVFDQIENDMEMKLYYKGQFQAPTPGTAGDTEDSMNGLKYLLENKPVNRINIGTLDIATIYDQIEYGYEQVAEEYQNVPMVVGLSPKWRRAFLKDKRALGYYQHTNPGQIDDTLDFSPAKVTGFPSMIGTDDIWITPVKNLIHLTKKGENAGNMKLEESKRCVSFLTDWWEGLGFGLNEVVWTTVEEATPPTP
ncbi:hypothetical protein [Dysgonomonas termitidis]|uniref:Uncharacterized protein n=1 Tax=Dysgonomonas termitidis TaxID=1516126 RepID=A0ABV9KU90_9BACT